MRIKAIHRVPPPTAVTLTLTLDAEGCHILRHIIDSVDWSKLPGGDQVGGGEGPLSLLWEALNRAGHALQPDPVKFWDDSNRALDLVRSARMKS